MPGALRTAAADNDLREIAIQIGVESGRPISAERIVDELVDCCEELATLSNVSQLGTAAPELGAGIRLFWSSALGDYFSLRRARRPRSSDR